MRTYTDDELWPALKKGDQQAFASAYEIYFGVLFRYALGLLKDEEATKDVVHDVFTNLWERRESITINASLSSYLYASTYHGVLRQIRRSQLGDRFVEALMAIPENEPAGADELVRERQLAELIEAEVDRLPPRMREVFQLSRLDYLSYKEISKQLGISENTVNRQISKALAILREQLKKWIFFLLVIMVLCFY